MKTVLLLATLLFSGLAAAQPSTPFFVAEDDNVALRFTAFALRTELAATDARVVRTRDWLTRAAQSTGEDERAVAAACVRAARFFQDLTRQPANALEPLEALARTAKPGEPMGDVLLHYIEARKQAADKSHAAALNALAGGKTLPQ